MTKITCLEAGSIADAFRVTVEFIEKWCNGDKPYVWFRGVKDRDFKLLPGALWRKDYDEFVSMLTFTQEGGAHARIGSIDEWETYYLAQHHAVPTRLLDWTLSFAAALFFAFDRLDGPTTPCVWLMQPNLFNKAFLDWEGIVAPECNPELSIWLPKRIEEVKTAEDGGGFIYKNRYPIAIYPRTAGGRLHAQQGTFTVHGRDTKDLLSLTPRRKIPMANIFARIDLGGIARKSAMAQLATLGVRRSTVFPDLDNFVREKREDNGWDA